MKKEPNIVKKTTKKSGGKKTKSPGYIIGAPTQGATPPPKKGFLVVVNGNFPSIPGGFATVGLVTRPITAVFALAPRLDYTVLFTPPLGHAGSGAARPVAVVKGLTTYVTVVWG